MNREREEKIEGRSGIVSRIEDILAGGYSEREDLRDLDKSLRDDYYSELMALRHRWEKVSLGVLNGGQRTIGSDCRTILLTIDRMAESIHRADYGYTGPFERTSPIQSETLRKVLQHDVDLAQNLAQMGQDISSAEKAVQASTWPEVSACLNAVSSDLQSLEDHWKKREQIMGNKDKRR